MKRESTLLFSNYELQLVLESQRGKVSEHVSKIPNQQLTDRGIEELVSVVEKEIAVEPIRLRENEITVDRTEVKVDVSHDFHRAIFDRSKPFYIDGVRVSYYVPFTGDKELLKCRPNSFSLNPPHARIAEHELIFEYDLANGDVASTKSSFEQELRNVRQWIQWNTAQVEEFNSGVQAVIRQGLSTRLQRLQESKKQVNDLGFKVRPKVNNIGLTNSEATQAKAVPQSRTRRKSSTKVREYDVALSFAGEDREYVDRVAGLLREAEVKVFYDGFEEVNLWGKNLADYFAEIYAKRSKFVVIFVSQHYAAKAWPNHERKHAQARAIQQQEDIVLPARFDDTELPGLPSSVAYLDLRKLTPEDLAERIIKKLQH